MHFDRMKGSRFKLALSLALLTVAYPLLVKSSFAQTLPVGGLYQIISGHYAEYVEAFGGGPPKLPLPTQTQSYVELAIDDQSQIVRMTILGSDMQTVFSSGDFGLSLTNGAIFPDYIQFDNRSGNQEMTVSDQYTISNSVRELRIDGATVGSGTSAVPFLWEYSNVVATLLAPSSQPILSPPHATNGVIQFRVFNGRAGETNVLEASTDLKRWIPVSTNVFPATVCATCPFIDIMESPNLTRRFYRSVRLP
jgi:hypothetical protein